MIKVRGLIQQHSKELTWLQRLTDGVLIFSGLYGAAAIYGIRLSESYVLAAVLGFLFFQLFAGSQELYSSWRGRPYSEELGRVTIAWLLSAMALLAVGFATKTSSLLSRVTMLLWFVLTLALLVLFRYLLRRSLAVARAHGRNLRRAAIVGTGTLSRNFARSLEQSPECGIRLLGFYDQRAHSSPGDGEGVSAPVRGDFQDLINDARNGLLDQVYIALPLARHHEIEALVSALADSTVSVFYLPDISAFRLLNAGVYSINGFPTISVYDTPFDEIKGALKRVEDVAIALAVLAVMAIPMGLIALAIKWDSPGPVLFKQRRYGLNGRPVEVWKFRTMTVCEPGDRECEQARKGDRRVTRLGAFLRRTSLDELPQFFNVLQGTMSVVGPRPHAIAHNEYYRKAIPGYMLRHKIKPGITGLAQVNGWRGETDTLEKMEMRVRHDLEYLSNWSLWLDIKIVVLTLFKGFTNKNAY